MVRSVTKTLASVALQIALRFIVVILRSVPLISATVIASVKVSSSETSSALTSTTATSSEVASSVICKMSAFCPLVAIKF